MILGTTLEGSAALPIWNQQCYLHDKNHERMPVSGKTFQWEKCYMDEKE